MKAADSSKYFERFYHPTVKVYRKLLGEFEMDTGNEEWALITEVEVDIALKSMKNRKAAGVCGIPPERLKC